MKQKNRKLVVILGVLVVLNVVFFFTGGSKRSLSFDETLFAVRDTSAIRSVSIKGTDREIVLEEQGGLWELNRKYPVDENLRRLLFSIMQRVRVRRPVERLEPEDGLKVSISGNREVEFVVFANPTKTRTFFYDSATDQSYEVEIPGYNEYLGGIFELKRDQWRDRLMLDESWRTIQQLALDYTSPSEDDLKIRFQRDFYVVEGIAQLDTSFVVEYLNQFQVFEANERISRENFPVYDSLSQTAPIAELQITSINHPEPLLFRFFPGLEGQAFHLVTDKAGELMVVDRKRVAQILTAPRDFQVED